jgi:hypothetical protein
MPADDRFLTRCFRDGDQAAILDLFARSFHHRRSLEHFDWKYRRDPYGAEHISLTFDAEERLVGHYCGYPVAFRHDGSDLIAHQIGDTMTEPSVRHIGRGPTSILGRTALHFYETFCDGKVGFNYGFNVANIQRFSLQFLRSDRVEPVTYWRRDLQKDPMAGIGRWQRWPRGYQLDLVCDAGDEFDRFFARVAPTYRFLVRRDATWIRWRYLQCPDAPYFIVAIRKWRRLVGWSVFRVHGDRLLWGDALFDPRHAGAVEVLLRHVVPSHAVDRIEAWFPRRPQWLAGVLEGQQFLNEREPQDLSLMCVPFTLTDATARMREALYYTMGDSDLF